MKTYKFYAYCNESKNDFNFNINAKDIDAAKFLANEFAIAKNLCLIDFCNEV